MVVLVVATASDPASIGPASAFLAMPGWSPGPPIPEGMESFTNGNIRLLKHDRSIIAEDNLDHRWQEATGEAISEVIFLSKHTAVSNRPALTVHPIGVPHLREDETPPQGGRPGWAALPNPRIGPWLRLMQQIAADQGLVPEFEITLEATHHGPLTNTPTMFVEIGSTEEYWGRQDAAQAIALVLWKGLGLEEGKAVGTWTGNGEKVLLGIGGGHYAPRHMDIVILAEKNICSMILSTSSNYFSKNGAWVGHLLSGYSLPMEAPPEGNSKGSGVGGMWKHSIKASFEATKAAFPGGEVIAHLDQKSFKGWQKNAITSYLQEENIRIGKPNDFL
ncbi:D-aminoacyl-tRNA deacylase isoform X2 [Brachypodium distachyon]|uniref:D-aminoacyl-tRNA deacylase isoform X2 n=1 Tax=Brachypodium distachyon TaxID=15368 RepID=UPI000D0E1D25|nr:D-aminoacyl-tRNA deacylase isoform X2 [Brachypodium distachyon]|eukprot:XP_024317347.1 D-aminoacyl-tRNA deacylase isoform X2 [Brachypodium distachyon]